MTEPTFRRPSLCASGGCVEVAATAGAVHVRDSKQPAGSQLRYDPDHWGRIVDDIKGGTLPFCIDSDAGGGFVWAHYATAAELRFTKAEIDAFLEAVEDGEFDVDVLAAVKSGDLDGAL